MRNPNVCVTLFHRAISRVIQTSLCCFKFAVAIRFLYVNKIHRHDTKHDPGEPSKKINLLLFPPS